MFVNRAAWYSAKLPSRPVQFTDQEPDYREAFWGFPHASIDPTITTDMVSTLYDRVISSTLTRLAGEIIPSDSCPSHTSESTVTALIVLCSIFGGLLILSGIYYWYYLLNSGVARQRKSFTGVSGHEDLEGMHEPMIKE